MAYLNRERSPSLFYNMSCEFSCINVPLLVPLGFGSIKGIQDQATSRTGLRRGRGCSKWAAMLSLDVCRFSAKVIRVYSNL